MKISALFRKTGYPPVVQNCASGLCLCLLKGYLLGHIVFPFLFLPSAEYLSCGQARFWIIYRNIQAEERFGEYFEPNYAVLPSERPPPSYGAVNCSVSWAVLYT
ncbi:hypothetical protein C8J57DRAFT_1259278 [Mycena rebaudengoi]|nr:hypothetical protein C8J57DRAFT_1259278 [Mycena rebaudengoi]